MTHTHGGARPGSGRKKGDGGRPRQPVNPAGPKVYVSVRLDPVLHQQVMEYAEAKGITVSKAISILLSGVIQSNPVID